MNLRIVFFTLPGLLFSPFTVTAQNATLTLQGEFFSGTCDVALNGAQADGTVTLPKVSTDELNQLKITGETTFYFTLTNCASASNNWVIFYFEGGNTVDTTNYYVKNSDGSATGVELILKTPGGNQIKPGTDTQAGENKFADSRSGNFSVSYVTDNNIGPATPGTVISHITYHLEYK
ncbi:fimbrial protein [Enterobacter sp. CC120223-11]|uniref:fimbrial protein n=1 Tax=Enterobacter sp. CC120223-11 TaxID=1378073 RepID=UPI000BD38170|nr:fimbrial protein [Enterobacter sp. CC120223-11]SNY58560.1 major type 1 subunit fimbrin (pilin) [Enterobacter sp. CC120223-11]